MNGVAMAKMRLAFLLVKLGHAFLITGLMGVSAELTSMATEVRTEQIQSSLDRHVPSIQSQCGRGLDVGDGIYKVYYDCCRKLR